MNIKNIVLLLAILVISQSHFLKTKGKKFNYSLPGDKLWPTKEEFNNLKATIGPSLILRGEKEYYPYTYNNRTNNPEPAVIAYVKSKQEIQTILKFAQKHKIRLAVQSTGHHQDIRNTADNSILIHMGKMKN